MRSLLVILTLGVGLVLFGCSKKQEGADQGAAGDTTSTAQTEQGMMPDVPANTQGTETIPMSDVPETPVAGLSLNPYFDEAGTSTELSVARGEQFKLYIMGTTVDPYEVNSAQLRMQLPPGLTVLYTVEHARKTSSLGQHDFNYMVVFDCTPPGRFVVVSYVIQVSDDFSGGEIQVLPGFLSDNATFLGFATCEFEEIRAAGGTATVKLKS